ncbi:metal ABC transporter permease [Ornithinibacillus massiliensis]|uniref:Metal ABC transporter permease n=1 Tax=Ornithinibacillus massiliensis TaxID=1944633 RepID=A0ABS5MIF6_9BACI|nr:metal ABC transporter permease [Ornithinibacillus massiliensis]MBS3682119.1 metal ABC transporter permease [Ornithinibacillus massiliensis]
MIADLMTYDFLRQTFLTGILIGIIAPLLGTFIVVRRLSLIADALSHVTLSGIAFSLFIEKKFAFYMLPPLYGGLLFSVLGSIFIEKLRSVYKAYQEIAIPIILSGGVGLSVIFIALADGFNTELMNYLFGSASAVSKSDFFTILIITVFVLFIITIFYKELFTLSFDEEHSKVSGIHSKQIHLLFIILTALVIAGSIQIVGVLLVSALMTLPVAASMRIAKGFKQMMFLAIAFGELAVMIGLISGYYLNIPPGGTIVMVAIIILLLSIAYKRLQESKMGAKQ